jgi:hypothetical protein
MEATGMGDEEIRDHPDICLVVRKGAVLGLHQISIGARYLNRQFTHWARVSQMRDQPEGPEAMR